MSAVPKKKLCWNCEGNVARDIDNCPYCAVYLHGSESENENRWDPSYYPSSKNEEIPTPPYQIQSQDSQLEESPLEDNDEEASPWGALFFQLKQDVFPLLFLMAGSIFFLFGIVLLLFSQNGFLILQWKESYSLFFLLFAFPLIAFGWKLLQRLD